MKRPRFLINAHTTKAPRFFLRPSIGLSDLREATGAPTSLLSRPLPVALLSHGRTLFSSGSSVIANSHFAQRRAHAAPVDKESTQVSSPGWTAVRWVLTHNFNQAAPSC